MSKIKNILKYETFDYVFNREHGVVFIPKNLKFHNNKQIRINEHHSNASYTINELGMLGLELIQFVENRQTNGNIANRIAIFLYTD